MTAARTIRITAWLVGGAVIAAALGAGAAAMADDVRSRASAGSASTLAPTLAPAVTAPAEPSPVIALPVETPQVSAAPSPAAAPPVPKPLLNLRTVKPWEAITLDVPSGISHCPAATVPLKNQAATVDGIDYRIYGDGTVAFTDLTGDGRDELVMAIECGARGRALLAVSATGPDTFATIAVKDLSAVPHVRRLTVNNGIITTYDVDRPVEAAADVRTYALRGKKLVQLSAAPKPADWPNATITMPAIAGCPAGAHTFTAGRTAARDGQSLRIHADAVPLHLDVDHDGSRETLLQVECVAGTEVVGSTVVALSTTGAKAGRVFGTVFTATSAEGTSIDGYSADRDQVGVTITRRDAQTGQTVSTSPHYGWSGTAFVPMT